MRSYTRVMPSLLEYAMTLLVVGVVLLPVFWIALSAFKTRLDIYSLKVFFHPTLVNFSRVLFYPRHFTRNIVNSFLVSGLATFIGIGVSLPAAYGFSRFSIWGKNSMLFWIISLQFIPPVVILLPFYLFFRQLNLLDTRLSLIVIYLTITVPFSIWILKGFIDGIPQEIEEAAMIDGASPSKIIWHIIVPIAKPAIIVAVILSLILTLNEFIFALVLTRKEAATMPIALMGLETNEGILWEQMAATGLLMMVPVFAFAYFLQKHLVGGLTLGAVK